jgi:hypothetical protein
MGTLRRNFRDLRDNLMDAHRRQRQHIAVAIAKGLAKPSTMAFNINKAMRTLARKTARYYGQTSKHKPHQGDRERARRLRVGSPAWYSNASAIECGHGVFKVGDKPDGSKVAG